MRTKILIFLCVTMGLLSSYARSNDVTYYGSINSEKSDSTLSKHYIKVNPFNLNILTPSSGVQFFKDGIVFLSSTKSDGKMSTDHVSFGKIDTRYAELRDSSLEAPVSFSPSSSFPYPSDAITFSSDNKSMYFTKYSKTAGGEKIYHARFTEGSGSGSWSFDENPVSFCSDNSTYTHPALSADGKLMIFASNRPGSIGGLDLYASLQKNGTWSDPVNLGDAVNSTANELYPYLDSKNNLYFSSDNIQGFGGYDIYVCKYKGNTWERPINLSSPVNTSFDDVAFKIDKKEGKSAFYTVKQKSDIRSVQLYKVTMDENNADNLLTLSEFFTRPDISQMVILALEPAVQATDAESVTATGPSGGNDIVSYKVQFMTSFNPRTRSQITVKEKAYEVSEYLYSGAYRLCVGEFSSLSPAIELQNLLMRNGYPQAFVVVFKNNVISLDPELLDDEDISEPAVLSEEPTANPVTTIDNPPQTVKEEVNTVPEKPAEKVAAPVQETIPEPEPLKVEAVQAKLPAAVEKTDEVIYRVQILTTTKSKGSYQITINNKNYDTFEYFYVGAYRTCVGNYSSLTPAKELQSICRKNGHPQAFVVAFKDGKRSTDAALFK